MTVSATSNLHPAVHPDRPAPTIDGGYIILRRNRRTRRYTLLGHRPFEHGSQQEAETQAAVMAERYGDEFAVLQQVATIFPPVKDPKPNPAAPDLGDAAPAEIEATRFAATRPPKPTLQVEIKRRRIPSLKATSQEPSRPAPGPVKTFRPTVRRSRQPGQGER